MKPDNLCLWAIKRALYPEFDIEPTEDSHVLIVSPKDEVDPIHRLQAAAHAVAYAAHVVHDVHVQGRRILKVAFEDNINFKHLFYTG